MPLVGAVSLHVSLLTFVLRVYVDRLDYVDLVLVCSDPSDALCHAVCVRSD
jgi:hypothetical protein